MIRFYIVFITLVLAALYSLASGFRSLNHVNNIVKIFSSSKQSRGTLYMNQIMSDSGRNLIANVNGVDLSYDLVRSVRGSSPAILFLPGLIREKNEAKSIFLKSLCKKADLTFLCADYVGVGKSKGSFTDGSVTRWSEDTISLIEKLIMPVERKVVLVGHALGSWISFIVAAKRPDLVSGIVALAADPDFTEELLWKKLPDDVKEKIMKEGSQVITWGKQQYPISRNLIEDGRKNLLLAGEPGSIKVKCPVRLIHGLSDEEVPYSLALKLVENLASSDTSLVLLKKSTHSMDTETDYKAMRSMISEVIGATYGEYDLRSPGSG